MFSIQLKQVPYILCHGVDPSACCINGAFCFIGFFSWHIEQQSANCLISALIPGQNILPLALVNMLSYVSLKSKYWRIPTGVSCFCSGRQIITVSVRVCVLLSTSVASLISRRRASGASHVSIILNDKSFISHCNSPPHFSDTHGSK